MWATGYAMAGSPRRFNWVSCRRPMKESFRRLLQAIRFERDAFVWMDFNDRASGDALIIVAITRLLIFLGVIGFGSIRGLFSLGVWEAFILAMVQGLVFWLIFSGVAYAILRFLFQVSIGYPIVLRIAGFAYPATLVVLALVQIFPPASVTSLGVITLVANAWFFAIVAKGLDYVSDADLLKGIVAAVGGWLGYLVVSAILGGLPL